MAQTKPMVLTPSWQLAKQSLLLVRSHITPLIYLVLLPGLVYSLGGLIIGNPISTDGRLSLELINPNGLILIGIAAVWMLINLGPVTHFELSATKQPPQQIRAYYARGLRDSWRLAVLYLLTGLIVIFGLIALIVPGLIALRMLILAPYYLVDKKLGIIEAIKVSARASKPPRNYIWGVIGVQVAVAAAASILGAFPVFGIVISLLLTYSITFLMALRYRTIER